MISKERAQQLQEKYGISPGGTGATGMDMQRQEADYDPATEVQKFNSFLSGVHNPQSSQPAQDQAGGGVGGFLEKTGKTIGEVGQGFAKGVASLPSEAASLGKDIEERVEGAVRPDITYEELKKRHEATGIGQGIEKTTEQFAPKTAAEKFGFGAEKIAEFFVPVGAAEKLATKGAELALGGEKAVGTAEKLASFGKKALDLGRKSASEAFEMGARTALQEGKADERSVVAAGVGAAMPVIGKTFGLAKGQLPKLSQKLEEINLRLTPAQRRQFTNKIDDVTKYLSENKVVGTAPRRLEKITEKYEAMEPQLDKFLKETAKDRSVPKADLLGELEGLKSKYQDRVDSDLIEGQIDRVIDTIKRKQSDQIPVLNLNKLKRSAYDSAYNEAGNKVLDDTMHEVGDVLRSNIEKSTEGLSIGKKSIADFNKEYSTLINARKLLKAATSRKDVGFLSKVLSTLIGGSIGSVGGPMGSAIGAALAPSVTEVAAGTLPRSAVAAGLQKASQASIPEAVKTGAKALMSQGIQD